MSYGENLKAAREKAGYSTRELARRVSCSERSIKYYEMTGRKPSLSLAVLIAQTLYTTVEEMMRERDDEE